MGSHTSIDRNMWLHCGGQPYTTPMVYFEIGEHSFIGCNAVLGAGGGICIGNNVLIGQNETRRRETRLQRSTALDSPARGKLPEYCDRGRRLDRFQGVILAGVTVGRGAVIAAGGGL